MRRDGLNRWLPLVKWLLAIPHFIILVFLTLAAFVCVIVAWFAILFTGRYPAASSTSLRESPLVESGDRVHSSSS